MFDQAAAAVVVGGCGGGGLARLPLQYLEHS